MRTILIKSEVGLTKTIIEARVTPRGVKHVWTVLVSIIHQKILTHACKPDLVTFEIPIIILLWP
jgi:primosomal replication protein N